MINFTDDDGQTVSARLTQQDVTLLDTMWHAYWVVATDVRNEIAGPVARHMEAALRVLGEELDVAWLLERCMSASESPSTQLNAIARELEFRAARIRFATQSPEN